MSTRHDLLIRGAMVYAGAGGAPFEADVAVDGEHIAALGSLDADTAALEIDARGLSLSPGFIDVHTHDDFAVFAHADMGFKSRGGVTTCIVGNCGFGAAPFPEASKLLGAISGTVGVAPYEGHAGYAAAVEAIGPGVNIGALAGHGTIRKAVVGSEARIPTDTEMKAMQSHLREALDAGVLGLSSGLIYDPGRYAATDELVELASVMRGSGALYATHMRDEGGGLLTSVNEALEIGARAGVGVQISHHKASGRENWGLVAESLQLIERAQAKGVDVHADQYPYTAGSTMLRAVLENGAFSNDGGGFNSLMPEDLVVASAPAKPEWEGQSIAALCALLEMRPLEAARAVLEAEPQATAILHMMSEQDVRQVLAHPSTMIGSDGIPTLDGKPHPRLYNSFARVLGHYARDEDVVDLATAVHRMTGMSAAKFGLSGRGAIVAGAYADLVLFDARTVLDKGTFTDPNQYPAGIHKVFVNGQLCVSDDALTGKRAGHMLRRQ